MHQLAQKREKYFTASSLKELLESIDNRIIIDCIN